MIIITQFTNWIKSAIWENVTRLISQTFCNKVKPKLTVIKVAMDSIAPVLV